jgi:hypothetical protein
MGWWKVKGTDHLVGDVPLDALGDAVGSVVAEYQTEFGRRPTKAEWEALLRLVFGNEMPEFRSMDEGVVERVVLEVRKR